jgi:inner membrane protein
VTVLSRLRRPTRVSPAGLALAALVFVAADVADTWTGGGSFLPSGPVDETAHLLTAVIVLWAIGGAVFERLLVPALVASVAIDLDHIPRELGGNWLTAGTPRPYTHSLLTIAVVLIAAWLWRRRRTVLLGIALGLAIHFWRDLTEPGSGVSLLSPFSNRSVSASHVSYLIVMAIAFVVGMWRALRWQREASRSAKPTRVSARGSGA